MKDKRLTRPERSKVLARAWKDAAYRKRLFSNPHAALKELGFDVPSSLRIEVKEETENTSFLIIPPAPTEVKELSDVELEQIAAAQASSSWGCTDSLFHP